MEVHAHSHRERKKWTHYLWEFLMLFLAVFCGFLAENFREHQIEHQREKQYIRSYLEDLKTDTTNLGLLSLTNKVVIRELDSLLFYYDEFATGRCSSGFTKFSEGLNGFVEFNYTDKTIQQLKNSGGMRLIREPAVSDSIIQYDVMVKEQLSQEEALNRLFELTNNNYIELFNLALFEKEMNKNQHNPELLAKNKVLDLLLTHDKQKVWSLYHYISIYKSTIEGKRQSAVVLKEQATRLISFLKKEYHL
jgi:hypothetical protein